MPSDGFDNMPFPIFGIKKEKYGKNKVLPIESFKKLSLGMKLGVSKFNL